MTALDMRRSANVLQRAWCTHLLERAPAHLTVVRGHIEEAKRYLEEHPTATLHEVRRERLARYEILLGTPSPRAAAKPLPRQLNLPEPRT